MEENIELLQEMVWLIGFGLNCLWDIVDKYQKNFWLNNGIPKYVFLNVEILLMVASKYIINSISWKSQKDLPNALKYVSQTGTDFLLDPGEST